MKSKNWGIFVMENEVEQMKEIVENKGHKVFEVRKLNYWEKLMYCKNPTLFNNDPWIIMFTATRLQYHLLTWKLRLKAVF